MKRPVVFALIASMAAFSVSCPVESAPGSGGQTGGTIAGNIVYEPATERGLRFQSILEAQYGALDDMLDALTLPRRAS
jgi:hypothetical protein